MSFPIIIIGAGQAGAMVTANLRGQGFEGDITLIGSEGHHPYERPPLSKAALLNPEAPPAPILPATFFADNRIQYLAGATVSQINRTEKNIVLADGTVLPYHKLVLATGANIRPLSVLDALGTDKIHTLRTLEDAHKLRHVLKPHRKIALVGGGVIGLELAASAKALGCTDITVIEKGAHIMERISPRPLSDYLLAYHQKEGVKFHFNTDIQTATLTENGQVQLTFATGETLLVDDVIYGIGVIPNTQLAQSAGLDIHHGVVIDHLNAQTSDADIFAAGDVATCFNPDENSYTRRETWENANLQAAKIANSILNQPQACDQAAWFWTDQYDLNIQFVGDMVAAQWICRGQQDDHKFILFGLDENQILVGAITINMGREMRNCRKLVAQHTAIAPAKLMDEAIKLKDLLY